MTVNGNGAGWTQLAFNTYDKPIEGGGASTSAVRDPAFRAALDRAVDREVLVDQVLNGYGIPGSTIVAPTIPTFRKEPANPRPFDLTAAAAALDAAGYVDSNGDGSREDKEGKEINLRIYFPDTDSAYPKSAQFVGSRVPRSLLVSPACCALSRRLLRGSVPYIDIEIG